MSDQPVKDEEIVAPTFSPLDYLAVNHPGKPGCNWAPFHAVCLLIRTHPTPHLLQIEAAMIPNKKSNEGRDEA
jgi:hypothetical protein